MQDARYTWAAFYIPPQDTDTCRERPSFSPLGVLLRATEKSKQQVQHRKRQRAKEGCLEGRHGEAGNKFAREPENHCIDDEKKDSERQNPQRQRDDLEKKAQRRIEQPDHDDRNQGGEDAVDVEALDEVRDNQQGKGIQNPVQKQTKHSQSFSAAELKIGIRNRASVRRAYPTIRPRLAHFLDDSLRASAPGTGTQSRCLSCVEANGAQLI